MKIQHVKNVAVDLSRREFPCPAVIKANRSHFTKPGATLTHADPALIFSIQSLRSSLIFCFKEKANKWKTERRRVRRAAGDTRLAEEGG